MYKLIQKNQKKFLAFFGVLLMIVFILPQSAKNSMNRGDNPIGKLDGEKIYGRDLFIAKSDLEMLRRLRFAPLFELGGDGQATVAAKFIKNDDGALAYLLLQKEAQKAGISVTDQDVDALIAQSYPTDPLPPQDAENIKSAVGRFMLVQAGFQRASDTVKVSKPLLQYSLAQVYQGVSLNLVEFRPEDLEKSVPEPTPEQIRQDYDKYADTFPQPPIQGYRVPNRVKLQYLEIPKAAVVQSVLNDLNAKEKYDLDVEGAYPYYAEHPEEGPSSQPIQSAPTTKPWDDAVKLELEKRLLMSDPPLSTADPVVALRARVAAHEKMLQAALHDELASAYADWAAAHPNGPPTRPSTTLPAVRLPATTLPATTQPATSPSAAYPDLDFLTAFAAKFEAKYKVRPLVNSLANKWLTAEDLNSLPEISSARQGETPFADYVMRDLAPPPATQSSSATLPAAPTTNPAIAPAATGPAATASAAPTTSATTAPAVAAGGKRFTVEEFAKADPEMASQFKTRGEAQILYDGLVPQLGVNNPAVKAAKASLDEQTARMQTYCNQLNERYSIRWNVDGTGTLVPRGSADQASTQPAGATALVPPASVPAVVVSSWIPIGTGLRPFEPSQVLEDSSGNAYVLRLTAFEPAHRPALAEVAPQIIQHLKLTAAMQRAHDLAAKLLSNAQIETRLGKEHGLPDLEGLPAAATASGYKVIATKKFRPRYLSISQGVPDYEPADFVDKMVFTEAIKKLGKQQTPDNLHPSTLLDLPAEHKVVVAEIGDATLPVTPSEMFNAELTMAQVARNYLVSGQLAGDIEMHGAASMIEDWFDLDNIIARVKYEKNSKG